MPASSIYRSLNPSKAEIRLLRIVTTGDEVSCTLSYVSLSDKPCFTALSYVWGDPTATEDICLEGQIVPVTKNLASALRKAQQKWSEFFPNKDTSEFRLWADAICINQADVDERGQQVQLMGEIYSSAHLVIAWINTSTDQYGHVEAGLEFFNLFADVTKDLGEDDLFRLEWMGEQPSLYEDSDQAGGRKGRNRLWSASITFFLNPYWSRVWIYQELVLAHELIICSPGGLLDMAKLHHCDVRIRRLCEAITDGRVQRPHFMGPLTWSLLQAFTTFDTGPWPAIGRVLKSKFRERRIEKEGRSADDPYQGVAVSLYGLQFKATDPKDHVYGLLGISRLDIVPNYRSEKSVAAVYAEYAGQVLRGIRTNSESNSDRLDSLLMFLRYAGIGIYDNHLGLPSWAPNFPQTCNNPDPDFATGDPAKGMDANVFQSPEVIGLSLCISGILFDRVSRVEKAPSVEGWKDGSGLAYMEELVQRSPVYVTGEPVLQAAFRIACGVKHTDDHPSPSIVLRALYFLEAVLCSGWDDIETHLRKLGMSREGFNTFFMAAFAPRYSGPAFDWWSRLTPSHEDPASETDSWESQRYYFQRSLAARGKSQRYFETEGGYLGSCPKGALPGDVVCVFKGFGNPVILRKDGGFWAFVGACYVHGIMDGEIAKYVERRERSVERFELR